MSRFMRRVFTAEPPTFSEPKNCAKPKSWREATEAFSMACEGRSVQCKARATVEIKDELNDVDDNTLRCIRKCCKGSCNTRVCTRE